MHLVRVDQLSKLTLSTTTLSRPSLQGTSVAIMGTCPPLLLDLTRVVPLPCGLHDPVPPLFMQPENTMLGGSHVMSLLGTIEA